MSLRIGHKLPKKTDSETFEKIVRDCAKKILPSEFYLYGRKGQDQHGIDIYNPNVDTVIQCKNYTTNNIKALKDAIEKDYQSAVDYFLNEKDLPLKTFIVATSVNRDTGFQDFVIEKNKGNTIKIEVWFWEDIEETVLANTDLLSDYYPEYSSKEEKSGEVHTDNAIFAKSFVEPLFLHKNQPNTKVKLCNLFVMPKYKVNKDDNPKTDLEDKLSAFVKSDKRFLFIEGDAGCGKSTLVSWMNYHLQNNDDTAKNIFGDKWVITIRLRDLDRDVIKSKQGLIDSILNHMKLETFEDMEERFSKAVMILDGFDELCMIENIENYNELIEELAEIELDGYQYIITSRPHYIKKEIDSSCEFITLQHFDKDKRTQWIEHYTSPEFCNQPLNDEIKKYIVSISDDTDSAICDTPMTLYMLAAKDISIDLTKNSWSLYHQIFYNELMDTDYNKMFGRKYKHKIHRYKEIFYKVTEEIAYQMYLSNNNQFYVSSGELREIIKKLLDNDTRLTNKRINYLIEQCYALCNYWKETGNGAVEFYHNNIRDFFLCEKIYRELNAIYADYQLSPNDKIGKLIEFFKQFKEAPLQDMVCRFILLRAEKDVNDKNSFVYREKEQRLLPYLFEKMLTEHKHYKNLDEEKHIEAIVNILSCTAQVYRHIYEYILEEDEYVKWWNSVTNINTKSDIITYCFRYIFCHHFMFTKGLVVSLLNRRISYRMDISSIVLPGKDLRYIDFQGANLSGANLSGAYLSRADLSGAYLSRADLIGADLSDADLSGAYLSGAYLSGAYLSRADLSDADLNRADLNRADLNRADLTFVDLRGAHLNSATLPDGFKSDSQEEQVQHLKDMNIPGLKI